MKKEEQLSSRNKEVWCSQKSSDQRAKKIGWYGDCQLCCIFCDKECSLRICKNREKEDLCCWQRSPIEWVLGRLEEKAGRYAYHLRRYEFWIKNGSRANDGTWEGERLEGFRKRYPEVYEDLLRS